MMVSSKWIPNSLAKAKKGECVECFECKVAGVLLSNAVRSTNLHSVVVVCCCAVLYGEGATKKNTFMHLYHIWKSDTGHSQTHDEHDGSHKNIHHFWKKNEDLQPNCTSQLSICPLAMS